MTPARRPDGRAAAPPRRRARAASFIDEADASLLDLIDNALNRGVVIEGDVVLGLADVDLVYLRLSILAASVGRLAQQDTPAPSAPGPRRRGRRA